MTKCNSTLAVITMEYEKPVEMDSPNLSPLA